MSAIASAGGTHAQGTLVEAAADRIVLAVPGTDYRLHLAVEGSAGELPAPGPAQRVRGTIHARAERIDVVRTGGRYIEPVYGRPRRLQGRVIEVDAHANAVTVHCGVPVICAVTDDRQKAGDFKPGMLVSFDVERGAAFRLTDARAVRTAPTGDDNPTPAGQSPTQGDQPAAEDAVPGEKTQDAGSLTADGEISGQRPPTGETPISGDQS